MPRPRLLRKKGKPVKEWTLERAAREALLRAPAPKKAKIKTPVLRIAKADLRVLPKEFASRSVAA